MKLKIENKRRFYFIIGIIIVIVVLMLLTYWLLSKKVALYAKRFVGEEEIRGNLGFKNKEFENMMKSVGWQRGQAWCMYFAKVVWINAHKDYATELNKLLSGGTVNSFNKVKNSPTTNFAVTIKPRVGDIAIWQKYSNGRATSQGHAAIVQDINRHSFDTIEGNTDDKASREGFKVAERERSFDFDKAKGLRLLGFITKV